MLAVAINYQGPAAEKNLGYTLGTVLMKLLDGFKMIKLYPSDNPEPAPLQLCRTEGYEELVKDIQQFWHPAESLLELRGPTVKLQRALRHMFFFAAEKKYEKVFIIGCDGIADFPWALQIVVARLPLAGQGQDIEWIRQADIIILDDYKNEESEDFTVAIKEIRADVPLFVEKISPGGLSPELQDSLEALFALNLKNRKRIKEMLQEKQLGPQITCEQAQEMAGELGVSLFLFGSVCDQLGYSVIRCRLGCF